MLYTQPGYPQPGMPKRGGGDRGIRPPLEFVGGVSPPLQTSETKHFYQQFSSDYKNQKNATGVLYTQLGMPERGQGGRLGVVIVPPERGGQV